MKIWLVFAGTVAVALAGAQASQRRLDEIWSYADARMDQQMDVWFNDGEFLTDIQLLKLATLLRPGDYESWTNLGWMLENVEDWDGALAVYKEYKKENSHDPDGNLPIGEYYFRTKKYALVPPELEPEIGRTPHPHPNVFRILAHAYERIGKLTDAERVWKKYMAVAPGDPAAKNNLARVEKKLGH